MTTHSYSTYEHRTKFPANFCPLCEQAILERNDLTSLRLKGKPLLLLHKLISVSPNIVNRNAFPIKMTPCAFYSLVQQIRHALIESKSQWRVVTVPKEGYFAWKDESGLPFKVKDHLAYYRYITKEAEKAKEQAK